MLSRFTEIAGALAIIAVGFTAVGALIQETAHGSLSESGPVLHSGVGILGNALDDAYTAQLALAQFPLPLAKSAGDEAQKALISSIQLELAQRGFDAGPSDGMVHPETRAAIRDYEASSGLDVTGEPSKNLLAHMVATRALGDAVVSQEQQEKRELVVRVQRKLAELGYDIGQVDGAVSPRTRAAIAAFETDRGLVSTGDLSPALLQQLGSGGPDFDF